jgi:hypothetical protein
MIEESLKPLIRQIRGIDDPQLRGMLCDSLLEMCDELISRGKDGIRIEKKKKT